MFKLRLNNCRNGKVCRICHKYKPLKDFDVDKRKNDGVTTRCKQCRRKYMDNYRIENRENVRSYQNKWVIDNLDKATKASNKWKAKNSEKRHAHNQVAIALRSGKLKRQKCVICGEKAEAHHEDYTKPLDVIWFCRLHHKEHHAKGLV